MASTLPFLMTSLTASPVSATFMLRSVPPVPALSVVFLHLFTMLSPGCTKKRRAPAHKQFIHKLYNRLDLEQLEPNFIRLMKSIPQSQLHQVHN